MGYTPQQKKEMEKATAKYEGRGHTNTAASLAKKDMDIQIRKEQDAAKRAEKKK